MESSNGSPKAMAMTISLSDSGKRFNRDWIFRHFTYTFQKGNSYAITGSNGSGKSTLLNVLSGNMMINEGSITWKKNGQTIGDHDIFNEVSVCAPYLEVVEEMTLVEFLEFHLQFKNLLPNLYTENIITRLGLEKAAGKQIRYYSSGMKQRVKLAQAIFSDTEILLLDEPCTNLDTAGISLYHSLIEEYCADRLVIVSSNDEVEYRFCRERLRMNELPR